MTRKEQERKKHKRIRCPKCNNQSKQIGSLSQGIQIRRCKVCGYEFTYDYHFEYTSQTRYNWNMKVNKE